MPEPKAESSTEPEPGPVVSPATEPDVDVATDPRSASEAKRASAAGAVGSDGSGQTADREWEIGREPDLEAEADRDSPHPSTAGHPLDDWAPSTFVPVLDQLPAVDPHRCPPAAVAPACEPAAAAAAAMDDAALRELDRKLAAIKQDAYTEGIGAGSRPVRTVVYAHLTDRTLLANDGVARIEGYGPALVASLSELLGHDNIVIQPVIDLNDDTISVDAYEIPHRIRERVKLRYPVEQFPYGTAETGINTDLDHIKPYDKNGPPGQTNTDNITPLGRLSHRIKTHGGWKVTRLDNDTLEWTTRNGFTLHVTHRGTYLVHPDNGPPEPDQPGKDQQAG